MDAYVFFLGAGASLGLLRVAQVSPKLMANRQVNRGLLVLLGCVLGARALYVLERWGYYGTHPGEIIQFLNGGLSAGGALAGGLTALALVAFFQWASLLKLGDNLVALTPPLAAGIWMGCWLAGTAYGPLTPQGAWWGLPVADESGLVAARLPLQLLAAASMLVCFWLLEIWLAPRRTRDGQIASLGCVILGLNLVFFLLLRSEPVRLWWGVSLDVWAALGVCLIGLISALWVFRPATDRPLA
jgi:phosphatidylglycerol---prolipoprotein diacylglyceryl transferase